MEILIPLEKALEVIDVDQIKAHQVLLSVDMFKGVLLSCIYINGKN